MLSSEALNPEALAGDLAELIALLSDEPCLVFGASGGAVTALALIDEASNLVDRAILHEPPLFSLLPDSAAVLGTAQVVFETAQSDPQEATQRFSDLTEVMLRTAVDWPRPEPIALPPLSAEELEKQRFALGRMAPATIGYSVPKSLQARAKIKVAAGQESIGQVARKSAEALALLLGVPFLDAPGNHLAPSSHPEQFAAWLAQALDW